MSDFNLGTVTAYGYAKDKGYTGTENEFAALMASYADVAEQAAESATQAAASATTASTKASEAVASATAAASSKTAAETAQSGAETAAQTATTKAGEASASATTASGKATEATTAAGTATTKASEATTAATTATTKAGEASTSATNAAASATRAQEILDSIPADYSQLSDDVEDLKDGLTAVESDVTDLKEELEEDDSLLFDETSVTITTESTPEMTSGYCDINGVPHTANSYEYTTDIIPVTPGDVVYCSATVQPGVTTSSDPCFMRMLTAYNGNTAISASGDSTGALKTYTVPNGINGIRITINLSDYVAGSLVVHHTTTRGEKIIKPELITTIDIELDRTSGNPVANSVVTEAITDIADYQYGKNLLDASQNETGFIQSNGTVESSYTNYQTSDYINVEKDKSYCISTYMTDGRYYENTRKACILFNASKVAVDNTFQNIASGDIVITPTVDGYLRVSYAGVVLGMVEVGTTHSAYEGYSKSYELDPSFGLTQTMISEIPNTLSGKKWAHCGDSASDYTNKNFESGTFSGRYKTFPRLIAERNNMTLLQDFMLSGRTLAYPADGTFQNSICAPTQAFYYQNIPADTDYITIMLGGNDCQHTGSGSTSDGEDATGVITLGTIMDGDPTGTAEEQAVGTSTYYGAWNTVCHWLRVNRPYAHVGIVIENMMAGHPDYTEAQIAIAKKWGYPYINLNGDQHTPTMIRTTSTDVPSWIKDLIIDAQAVDPPDNTHPNWQTHELESGFFEAWLRSI